MKKIIPVIYIIILALFLSFFVSKTLVLINDRINDPYKHPGSEWICENPKIVYYIPEDTINEEAIATTRTNGKSIQFTINTQNAIHTRVEAFKYIDGSVTDNPELLFSGTISYSKDEFTITIDEDSDRLFNGVYDSLVFHRVESETN